MFKLHQESSRFYTVATYNRYRGLSLGTRTGFPVLGWAGAHSSRKGLAPWRGQCHRPCVGVPPLRPPGPTRWVAPPNKKAAKNPKYQHWFPLSEETGHDTRRRRRYREDRPNTERLSRTPVFGMRRNLNEMNE